jgi:hypothetical protein
MSLKEKLEDWEWSDVWQLVAIALILTVCGVSVRMLTAPKNVDYYYTSHGQGQASAACVYAHWTWHPDELAFCSDDYQRATDFMAKSNAALPKR